jgi:hypothetical protein
LSSNLYILFIYISWRIFCVAISFVSPIISEQFKSRARIYGHICYDFYVIYVLTFYVVLDIQMYHLCRSNTVYYFMGIDVQNSIVIVCIKVSSYSGTVL